MNTPFRGLPESKSRIVYVRPVPVAELPEDLREQMTSEIGAEAVIYSVNDPDGKQLALVADRSLAFSIAKANDFAPVSVH